jgi:glycosyltransferase involved in cell wall biosynthesis
MPSARVSDDVPTVSVVVPVFNEEAALPDVRRRLEVALASIPFEIVLVDDGSTDGSVALVDAWCAEDDPATFVKLSRNFGMESGMSPA